MKSSCIRDLAHLCRLFAPMSPSSMLCRSLNLLECPCAQDFDAPSWYYGYNGNNNYRNRYCHNRNGDRWDYPNGDYIFISVTTVWCACRAWACVFLLQQLGLVCACVLLIACLPNIRKILRQHCSTLQMLHPPTQRCSF